MLLSNKNHMTVYLTKVVTFQSYFNFEFLHFKCQDVVAIIELDPDRKLVPKHRVLGHTTGHPCTVVRYVTPYTGGEGRQTGEQVWLAIFDKRKKTMITSYTITIWISFSSPTTVSGHLICALVLQELVVFKFYIYSMPKIYTKYSAHWKI